MSSLLQENLISTKEASEFSGYHSDYLARMCRAGKIEGQQVGRTWLVSRESVEKFMREQEERKRELALSLSRAREAEYQKVNNTSVNEPVAAAPVVEAASELVVTTLAPEAAVVAEAPKEVAAEVKEVTTPALQAPLPRPARPVLSPYTPSISGFRVQALALVLTIVVLGGATSVVSSGALTKAVTKSEEFARALHEGAAQTVAAVLPVNTLRSVAVENGLAMLLPTTQLPLPETSAVVGARDTVRAFASANLVEEAGEALLAVGVRVRDELRAMPQTALQAELALGNSVLAIVDVLRGGYEGGVYAFADASHETPAYVVGSTLALGQNISSTLATGIVYTPYAYERTTTKLALGAGDAVTNTIAAVEPVRTFVASLTTPRESGVAVVEAQTNTASAFTAFAPPSLSGVRDWFLNKGEYLARTTFGSFSIFYDWAGYAVATIIDPYTNRFPIVMVDYPQGGGATSASIVNNFGTTTVVRNVYEQYTTEGASVAYVDLWVARLQRSIFESIENIDTSSSGGGGITSVSGDIHVNSIVVDATGAFTGALSAGTTTVNGGLTVNGDTNITGTLSVGSFTVSNLSVTSSLIGPSFTATSTTATSTFAGGFYAKRIEAGDYLAGPYILATSTTATSVFSGNIAANGNTTIGDASSDSLTVNASIASSLIPVTGGTYDLGSNALPWRALYATNASTTNATSTNLVATNFTLGGGTFTSFLGNALTNIGGVLSVSTSSLASGFFQTGGNSFGATGVLGTNDAQALQLETNNVARITIDSSGNVGVGTSTPGSLLSLNNIANFTTATSTFYATGGINLAGGCFAVNGTCISGGGGSGTVSAGTAGQFAYYDANGTTVSGTSTVFVSPAGNVGVGTTSPYAKFSVAGQAVAEFFTATSTTATSTFALAEITNAIRFAGDYLTDLTGSGLVITAGALTLDRTGDWTGTLDGQEGSYYLDRGNHTGTQLSSTISDFSSAARTLLSSTATGLTYTSGTGVFSLTSGYVIPLIASTTEWDTAYSNRITSATYPLQIASNVISLAFGTTTANSWSQLQTFSSGFLSGASSTVNGTLTVTSTTTLATASGNVGIGETNPLAKLHVNGGVGSLSTGLVFGDGDTGIYEPSDDNINFAFAGTNRWFMTGASFYTTTGSAPGIFASGVGFRPRNNDGDSGLSWIAEDQIALTAGGVDTLVVNGTNVGIGTSSPYAMFSVAGQTVAEYFTATSTTATSTLPNLALTNLLFGSDYVTDLTGSGLTITSGALTIGTVSQSQGGTGITTYTMGDLLYADAGGNLAKLPIGSAGQVLKVTGGLPAWGADLTTGGGGGAGAWATTSDSLAVYPTDTSDVIIIGNSATSTASSILEVFGQSYFSNTLGIATTAPSSLFKLAVQGSALISDALTATNLTATGTLTVGTLTGPLQAVNGVVSATSTLSVAYGGTGLSTAPSYGQLLVGNASGGYTLAATSSLGLQSVLQGTQGQVAYFSGTNTAVGTSSLFLASSGNIGVGTTSPYQALSIVGTTTSTGGFTVDGNTNLLSYQGSTTISVLGTSNFYAGLGANGSTTKTNGNRNVFIGAHAGYAVTGSGNVYIGELSGYGQAGTANSGSFNTAVGSHTLWSNTTGNLNSAFGINALYSNTTGGNNAAFGYNALLSNLTGGSNSAYGVEALANVTGSNNTAIGVNAGRLISSGSENIIVGIQPNLSGSGYLIGSASNNIAIGFNTRFSNTSGNNQLNIGNFIYGTLPATTSASTFVEPTAGLLGIGSSSPYARLSVHTNNGSTDTTLFAIGSSTASATTTLFSISNTGILTSTASATSTFSSGLNVAALNVTGSATSTAANGFNITNGCYAVNGTCLTSFSNTLTAGGTATTTFYAGGVVFSDGTKLTQAAGSGNGIFHWDNTNNRLGVGTSTPWGMLSINPSGITGPAFVVGSSTGTKFIVANNGRVGVGTTTPTGTFSIVGESAATGAAPVALYVRSGDGGTGSSGGAAGNFVFVGGTGGTGSSFGGGIGGSFSFTGGTGGGTTAGYGGSFTVTGGAGGAGSSFGGGIDLTGGVGSGAGGGGDVTLAGGAAGTGNGYGGSLYFTGGVAGTGSTNSGGGSLYLTGGAGAVAGYGGSVNLTGGDNAGTLGSAGAIALAGGNTNLVGGGGGITLTGGYASSSSADATGGAVTITGGYASSTTSTVGGGAVTITGGSGGTGLLTTGSGGNVVINGGSAGVASGSVGNVLLASARGVVGVGTTSPFAKLSVHANNGTTNTTLFAIGSSTASATSTLFSISNTGVLTSNASATSTFSSGLNVAALNVTGSATSTFANGINIAAGCFSVNGTCIGAGSGTVSSGTAGQFPYYAANGTTLSATSTLFLATTGRIGIGSTTPGAKLGVTGDIYASGTVNAGSGYFLNGSLFGFANPTTGTVLLGIDNAVASDATTTGDGGNNTAIGYRALNALTTGGGNTAVGAYALETHQSYFIGYGNTAVGEGAARASVSGSGLTVIGYQAFTSNTSGGLDDTVIGAAALTNDISGTGNAVVGAEALHESLSSSQNAVLGNRALYYNGTSTGSVAIGYDAGAGLSLYQNQGAVIVGYSAGTSLGTGSDFNTLIGYQSGTNVTSGYGNILLGADPDLVSNLTTGDNNIGIGYGITFPSATANNQLNISNLLFGSLPATTSAPLYPTTGKIGIATSSPYAKLSIHANNGSTDTTLFAIGSSTASATTTLFSIANTGAISATGAFISTATGANTFPYASTTALSVAGTLYLNPSSPAMNGPLQVNSGVVSATTSIGVLYGGTGLTSAPSYGNILVGNASGGYTLTATSSLGLGTTFFQQGGNSFNDTATLGTNDDNALAFETNNTVRIFIENTGNVGIGNNSPAASVGYQVVSIGNATNGGLLSFQQNGTNRAYIYNTAGSDILNLQAASGIDVNDGVTSRLRVDTATGNVGVGTTTPWAQLSINPSALTSPAFAIGSSTGTTFMVSNGGRVGIGTTSPSAMFSLTGTDGASGLGSSSAAPNFLALFGGTGGSATLSGNGSAGASGLIVAGTGGGSADTAGVAGAGGTLTFSAGAGGVASNTTGQSGAGGALILTAGNGGAGTEFISVGGTGGIVSITAGSGGANGGSGGSVILNPGARGDTGSDGNILLGSARGRIGIATTSPYALLSIHASSTATNTTLFAIGSSTSAFSTTTLFSIRNTGAISATGAITSTATGANTFPYASTTALTVSGTAYIGTLNGPLQANNGVVSATTSIGVLYGGTGLTSAPSYGQLLLGNASGGYTLTATSSLGLQETLVGTQGQVAYFSGTNTAVGTSTLFLATNGNVGVGTTTPWAQLSVNPNEITGPAFAVGSSSRTLFAIGNGGQIELNPYTSTSTLVTYGGRSLFIASTTGSNYAFGLDALTNTATGSSNIAIGTGALKRTTGGAQNVAIGTNALFSNTTGSYNTALGYNVTSNDSGSVGNTLIGWGVTTETADDFNTLIGYSAYSDSDRGTALGAHAYVEVGAPDGIAIGYSSYAGNDGAVVLGSEAAAEGLFGIAIGYGANAGTFGSFGNISIGASSTANLTTGANNITIGSNSFVASPTASNQLNIGGILFGTLPATSTAFTLPTTGKIGIATSSPYAKLSVHANNGSTDTTLFAIGSSTASATTTLFSILNNGTINTQLTGSTSLLTFGGKTLIYADSSRNVGFGSEPYSDLAVTGTDNIALGTLAGNGISTGLRNVALGYSAQYSNGSYNVAIGDNASVQADYGIAIGSGANFVEANRAIGIGHAAYIGVSASSSISIGPNSSTEGVSSIAIGDSAYSGGVHGTALGYAADAGTGYSNLVLGESAGSGISGNGHILIGAGAFDPNGASNSGLNIGGILFGTLPATTTTFTLPTTGKIGIATSSPYAKLSVHANSGSTDTTLFAIGSSTASATTTLFSVNNAGTVTIGSLNGPLQAVNGAVSATSTLSVAYGGTGLSTAPSYGQLLVGNATGGYTLTATSSLGLQSVLQGTQGQVAYFSGTNTAVGTSSLFLATSGKIGIGTTTPFAQLQVAGNSSLATFRHQLVLTDTNGATGDKHFGLTYVDGELRLGSLTDAYASTSVNTVTINGNGLLYAPEGLSTAGNVTASVLRSLGAVMGSGFFMIEDDYDHWTIATTTGRLTFSNGNLLADSYERFTLMDTGNIGIASSSPFAKLSVHANNGDTNTTLFAIGSSTASATSTLFSISNTGVLTSTASATSTFSSGLNVAALNITGSATSTAANGINLTAGCFSINGTCVGGGSFTNTLASGGTATTTFYSGGVVFSDGTKLTQAAGSGYNALTWNNTNGRLGIGSTSPTEELSVAGDVLVGTAAFNDSTITVYSEDTGLASVGVSVLDPLNGYGSIQMPASIEGVSVNSSGVVSAIDGDFWLNYYSTGDIILGVGGGNTAIGNINGASVNAKLDVKGDTGETIPLFQVSSSTDTELFSIQYTGRVGIGSSTPGSLLSVQGIANFDTATSTFYSSGGINLTGGGCFAVNGTCVGGGSISGGSAGSVAFWTGATTLSNNSLFYFDNTNTRLGIGTSSPAWRLQIASTTPIFALTDTDAASGSKHLLLRNDNGVFSIGTSSDDLTSSTTAFSINPSGPAVFGLGTSSPFAKLSIHAQNGETQTTLFAIGSSTASATSTHFAVTNAGNVGVGTSTPWRTLSVSGTAAITGLSAVSGTDQSVCIDGTTFELTTQAGDTCAVSAARYKEHINTLEIDALDLVMQLESVSYEYKADETNKLYWGLTADNAASTSAQLAYFNDDGSVQTLNTFGFISLFTKGIQEINERAFIATSSLSVRIDALEDMIGGSGGNGSGGDTGGDTATSLTVSGAVSAGELVAALPAGFTVGSTTIVTTVPSELLAEGGMNIGKLAIYTLVNVEDAIARLNTAEERLDTIEERLAALEELQNATTTESFIPTSMFESLLASAFAGFDATIENGLAYFKRIKVGELVIAKEGENSAVGSGIILAGNTAVEVKNPMATTTSKIIITPTSEIIGSWYLSDKQEGSFRIRLSEAQPNDFTFDYLIIQTEGDDETEQDPQQTVEPAPAPEVIAPAPEPVAEPTTTEPAPEPTATEPSPEPAPEPAHEPTATEPSPEPAPEPAPADTGTPDAEAAGGDGTTSTSADAGSSSSTTSTGDSAGGTSASSSSSDAGGGEGSTTP